MSESKYSGEEKGEGKEEKTESNVNVDISAIDISPNRCNLTDALSLSVDFVLDKAIEGATWKIKYLVDSVMKRYIVILGSVDPCTYKRGKNSFTFKTDRVDVSAIKKSELTNAGLLIATLMINEVEVMDLKLVVQV